MKIKINGIESKKAKFVELKNKLKLTISNHYEIIDSEKSISHTLLDDEVVEITLSDKVKLSLSSSSFLSLFPDRDERSENLKLADCKLLFNDANTHANPIKIQSIQFLKTVNKDSKTDCKSSINVIRKLEKTLTPKEGIYNAANLNHGMCRVENPEAEISTDHPVLLLIHGTTSNTEYTFSDLWHSIESHLWIDHIDDTYRGNVYAFEHYTLSKTPLENARDLIRLLPSGANIHLLTHSRGGLIGELLSRGEVANNTSPFTSEEIASFDPHSEIVKELNNELINKKIKIERFVRVACPARGSSFAKKRPDIFFSIFLNTLGLIPALKNSALYCLVQSFLYFIASNKIKIDDIPGLVEMLPESTLIRTLNGSSIRSKSDLSIIAGDVEGAGAFKILESLTTRFFFLEQHDLIINTSSMTGGVRRSENIRHFFHQGPHVSHFHYFSNPVSLEHIVAGLDWKTGIEPEGFEIINKSTKGNRSYFELPEFSPKKASIVIIPGIFGSHIKPNNKRIWLNWNAITHGCFNKLKFENTNDASDGLIAKKYHNLIQFLSQNYNVIAFPYDWRLSLLNSSNKLTETLKKLLEKTKSEGLPIHLLAHSTGGLVARLITNNKSNIWQEMVSRNSRLLMLGTPHRGSFAISRLLMGQDRLSQLLTIAHFRDNKIPSEKSTIVETLASFPGLLELMPLRSEFNFFHTQSWNKQPDSLVTPSHECLKAAKELQQTHLDKTTLDGNMFIILGSSRETPNKFSKDKWEFSNTNQGDGFATWKSCRLQNIQTWYMNTSHGEMANNELAFPAIQQILETGDTNHLPRHANDFESTSQTEILSQQRSFLFPSKDELLDTSMSVIAKTASPQDEHTQIDVEVTHGDFAYAKYPVLTGHYDGDSIRASDIQFDNILGGCLSKSFELGLYPGPIRTSEIFLRPNEQLRGVIVVGLGRIGTLTTNKLKLSITYGILDYIRTLQERKMDHSGTLGLSFLLLASSEGGLPLEHVLLAILRGVINANSTLESNVFGQLRINHIEFIEWYLDKAARATYYLKNHSLTNEFKQTLKLKPFINSSKGGKERIANTKVNNRWQSLQIVKSESGELYFTSLTRKARAEATLISTQRKLIDKFIHSSISTVKSNSGLSTTLFELIMPLELKANISEQADIQLILDEDTARYPWELLQGRAVANNVQEKPFSVQSGLVRQLILDDYRRQPSLCQCQSALIIGDPELGSAIKHFKPLSGAKEEAKQVAVKLKELGYRTTLRLNEKSDSIIQALYKEPYRIIHLAGHGVYKYKDDLAEASEDSYTGMVLGDGIYLSAREISQMGNVPDIVFVNCCHTGFIEKSTTANKLAANLASQLIKNGVVCVIAAGWAVNDHAAKIFAEEFYTEMLERNETFGRAVQHARQRVYEDNPEINTWGAYQCYGPHDFRMQRMDNIPEKKSVTSIQKSTDFTLPKELALALNSRSEELLQDQPTLAEAQTVREELKLLTRSLPPVWRKDGLLLSTIGNIYSILADLTPARNTHKLNDYKLAKDFYKKAFNAEKTNFPLDTIEQFAHVEMCRAECLMQNENSDENSEWLEIYNNAIQKLNHLTDISPNSYRFTLLGEAYRKKFILLANNGGITEIEAMQDAYKVAREKAEAVTGLLEPSSAFNYLLATTALCIIQLKNNDKRQYSHWNHQLASILSQIKKEKESLNSTINLLNYKLVNIFLIAEINDGKYANVNQIKQDLDDLKMQYQAVMDYYDPDDNEKYSQLESARFLYEASKKNTSSDGKIINQSLQLLSNID